MNLRSDGKATLLRRVIIRAPELYSRTSTLPLSARLIILPQRAISSNSKDSASKTSPVGKVSKEIPIIGTGGKGLFESLGISRKFKLVAITIFVVLSTIESMFWISMLWRKYGPREVNEEED
jgi:hypothetical protein